MKFTFKIITTSNVLVYDSASSNPEGLEVNEAIKEATKRANEYAFNWNFILEPVPESVHVSTEYASRTVTHAMFIGTMTSTIDNIVEALNKLKDVKAKRIGNDINKGIELELKGDRRENEIFALGILIGTMEANALK